MAQVATIVFGAAWTVATSIALGLLLLRPAAPELRREEQIPLAFVAGAACLSLVVFLLSVLQLVYGAVFLAAGALSIGLALYFRCLPLNSERFKPLPKVWRRVAALIFTVFGILYLSHAMAPEMSPDGSTYHLGLVGRFARNHGFERITTNMYANLSQGIEMLYLYAYAFGRHSAAALVHAAFLGALTLMMVNYGRRFGFPAAGAAGALLFFVSPVVGKDGSTAYNDVAVACVIFAVFYLVQVWAERRPASLLIPIGIVAGFCYAAKYTAFLAIPYAMAFLLWKLARARQPWFRPLLTVGICALLMMTPWMLKNWIWLDNPFSPFFNAWFPNPHIHQSFEAGYARHMRNYEGIESRWAIPLEVTVRGTKLCGLVGPVFLLAPLALLALRHPHGRKLLLAALVFGATYGANIGTRFLIPALPFVALAFGLAIARYQTIAVGVVLVHAVLSWPDVMRKYADEGAWKLEKTLWREALRIKTEDEFLRSNLIGYATARMIEEKVPPGDKVLTFSNVPEAYTTREILVVYQSAWNELLGDTLWTPLSAGMQPTQRFLFSFEATELRKTRVTQTARRAGDQWSIAEFRVYSQGRELPRSPAWRLRASPNPWDVQRAFDNSPVTRWRSWQDLYDGMFVEVDFGEPRLIDGVALETSPDQGNVALRLEGADANGEWTTLGGAPEVKEIQPPAKLRRAAAEELKNAGVRYFLVHDTDHFRDDFLRRQHEWGFTPIGETEGKRLYRID
ncbi:MAG: glycosyltransferase family 39 protein [Bryobacteraceae bacterium]|nr:glycosyltransferase family 39 protein [Bryobacteraceae bacterium]